MSFLAKAIYVASLKIFKYPGDGSFPQCTRQTLRKKISSLYSSSALGQKCQPSDTDNRRAGHPYVRWPSNRRGSPGPVRAYREGADGEI